MPLSKAKKGEYYKKLYNLLETYGPRPTSPSTHH